MSVYNNQHKSKSRGHNWVHFFHRLLVFCHLELKLCYLKNLNLFSITVKELFERMVDDEFWIFLKAFSWETDIWATLGDFTEKKKNPQNWEGKSAFYWKLIEYKRNLVCGICLQSYVSQMWKRIFSSNIN